MIHHSGGIARGLAAVSGVGSAIQASDVNQQRACGQRGRLYSSPMFHLRYLVFVALLLAGFLGVNDAEGSGVGIYGLVPPGPPRELTYFLGHILAERQTEDAPWVFEDLPEGIRANIEDIGHMGGRKFYGIRYLSEARLQQGVSRAAAILIIEAAPYGDGRFTPTYFEQDDEGVMEDYECSTLREIGGRALFWMRGRVSGNGGQVMRVALSTDPDSRKTIIWDLFSDEESPLKALYTDGWETDIHGNFFDDERLVSHCTLYKREAGRRKFEIPYAFKDGKLRPGTPAELTAEE